MENRTEKRKLQISQSEHDSAVETTRIEWIFDIKNKEIIIYRDINTDNPSKVGSISVENLVLYEDQTFNQNKEWHISEWINKDTKNKYKLIVCGPYINSATPSEREYQVQIKNINKDNIYMRVNTDERPKLI